MTATATEALELALWLHRAPAHRDALVGRPLPAGIGQLLKVATGAQGALADAARSTGEPEPVVLEAVRFYLQQVLFHEDADAYRILGLQHDATQAQAREHHRLLQHWLHPDRRASDDWESVYAGRVNRAWTQLRTGQSRQTYDESMRPSPAQSQAQASPMPMPEALGQVPVAHLQWRAAEPGSNGHRGRNITIGVIAGCLGLLFLIAQRPEAPPQWVDQQPAGPVVATNEASENDDAGPAFSRLRAVFDPPSEAPPTRAPEPPAMAPDPPARAVTSLPPVAEPPSRPIRDKPIAAAPTQPLARVALRPDPAPQALPVSVAPVVVAPFAQLQRPAPAPASVPASIPLVPVSDPLARMAQARDRTSQVVSYLGDSNARQPPVWNDLRTVQEAEGVRGSLHARLRPKGHLRIELEEPKWRLSATGARLDSGYRVARERGRLGIDFVWREEQLLVSAISLVPAQ